MIPPPSVDVLVIGSGPAALAIAAELTETGLNVGGVAEAHPTTPWVNTYGIWGEEVDQLGLQHLLEHRWSDTVSHFGPGSSDPSSGDNQARPHDRDYGLFDKAKLQQHWLACTERHSMHWWTEGAASIEHQTDRSIVITKAGTTIQARLVIDATGHNPAFVKGKATAAVAGQAAYGIVARFNKPPITPGQFVFMDYRSHHLDAQQRQEPPTFLYAMDLGQEVYFVEETSLALAPAVPFAVLQQRLRQRLAIHGCEIKELLHEEFCLFPMDPPLPDLNQRVVGFGGAGGMVHPASGFMVGSLLRRAPSLATAIADALKDSRRPSQACADAAWKALWPLEMRVKREFYRFGLSKLMGFNEERLRHHFDAFFKLPNDVWYGFLTNSLNPVELAQAMAQLFGLAPWDVRTGLLLPAKPAPRWQSLG